MKLKILTLEVTDLAVVPNNVLPFRNVVFYIKELFMAFLPDIEINNSSKIELSFGPRGNEVKFDGVLGSTNVFIEDFNFIDFYNSSLEQQQNKILQLIVKSLTDLVNKDEIVTKIIQETAARVIESGFNIKMEIRKLSKTTPDKLYRIKIYRCINSINGELWICEIYNTLNKVTNTKAMTKDPAFLDKRDFFKSAQIDNIQYLIFNGLQKVVFQFDLMNF